MTKKITLSIGLLTALALPIATTIACGSPTQTTYYFHNEISKYQSEMISTLNSSDLTTNASSFVKGQHVSAEKLGLNITHEENLNPIYVVKSPLEDNQISVDIHIEQGNKKSRTKSVIIYAKDSDQGIVFELSNKINNISIITNKEIVAVAEETSLDQTILNGIIGSTGKIFGTFPTIPPEVTITYQVPEIKFGEQKNLAVTISKGEKAKRFSSIKTKVQTTDDNLAEQQAIDDVYADFEKITKITSTKKIAAVDDLTPLTLAILEKYGEVTGTKPTNLRGTILTHTVEAIDIGSSGQLIVHINKGIGDEKTINITVEVSSETTN